jgi:hypothetical protein
MNDVIMQPTNKKIIISGVVSMSSTLDGLNPNSKVASIDQILERIRNLEAFDGDANTVGSQYTQELSFVFAENDTNQSGKDFESMKITACDDDCGVRVTEFLRQEDGTYSVTETDPDGMFHSLDRTIETQAVLDVFRLHMSILEAPNVTSTLEVNGKSLNEAHMNSFESNLLQNNNVSVVQASSTPSPEPLQTNQDKYRQEFSFVFAENDTNQSGKDFESMKIMACDDDCGVRVTEFLRQEDGAYSVTETDPDGQMHVLERNLTIEEVLGHFENGMILSNEVETSIDVNKGSLPQDNMASFQENLMANNNVKSITASASEEASLNPNSMALGTEAINLALPSGFGN